MKYAFTFDASACSGCKACQAACKDKNDLPVGVLWRRTYEVGGGEWSRRGEAWISTVYAYNLSMACNHCVHPKCAGVCPVDAFSVREDGIVLLDSSLCIGCGYCSWACPYGAPQYNRLFGIMTKCNLCYDNLDAGQPPACVAACPLRVLDLVDQATLDQEGRSQPVVFPMPATSRTEPRLYIKTHPAAVQDAKLPEVLNLEEFAPLRKHTPGWAAREEIPLAVFTLSGQMAVGIAWFLGILVLIHRSISPLLYMSIGGVLGLGLIASFGHLGSPHNAWRVFRNLKKSSLSREILAAAVFLLSWGVSSSSLWFPDRIAYAKSVLSVITGLAGAVLVLAMADVYRLRMIPAWNTWRTPAAFLLSAGILGGAGTVAGWVVIGSLPGEVSHLLHPVAVSLMICLCLELMLAFSENHPPVPAGRLMHVLLIGAGLLTAASLALSPSQAPTWMVFLVFLLVMFEQCTGRWLFYASRNPVM